jgi:hypothetical protein
MFGIGSRGAHLSHFVPKWPTGRNCSEKDAFRLELTGGHITLVWPC